jgi:hypothetical protein
MRAALIVSLIVLTALGGCGSIKRLTGQTDDSVLPGQREDVLPPEKQVARDPAVVGGTRTPTSAGDSIEQEPIEQEPIEPKQPASQKCKLNDVNCEPGYPGDDSYSQ